MDTATFGVRTGEHIPGAVVHAYLERYAERFGIRDAIRQGVRVVSATHCGVDDGGGWDLVVATTTDQCSETESEESIVHAKKLVVATGLTSEPFVPDLAGKDEFDAPLFHGKDLPQQAQLVEEAQRVTVYGGGKMAFDAVYEYASHGVEVDWVIRGASLKLEHL
jgi:cation diffusion facilitator CzcD-associated flavoprotein CzcO